MKQCLRRSLVPRFLNLLDFVVLLSVHAAVDNHDEAISNVLQLFWDHVSENASPDEHSPAENASEDDDVVVTGCVLFVEPGLDHEAVCSNSQAGAAE